MSAFTALAIRRLFRRTARSGIAAVLLVALSALPAFAFWATLGEGFGTAATGTLAAPTGTTAASTPGSGTVSISWTAPATGAAPSGYTVSRVPTSGSPVSACGTGSSPVTTTSCSDTSVPDGTYTYVVTSVRGSWTATGAPSSSVTVSTSIGTTTAVSSSTNPSVVGQLVTYTATVTPASGSTTPTGTVTFKDGTSAISCTGGNQTLSSGTATCSLTYSNAGSHSITAVYLGAGVFAGSTSQVLSQTVNPPASATQFVLTPSPTTVTAGSTLSLTITAKLANGTTTDTSYSGTKSVVWSGTATASSPNGTLPTLPTAATFANGVANVAVTLTAAGAGQSLTASDGAISGQANVTVNPAAANSFNVAPTVSTVVAGANFNITLRALDGFGNTATAYSGSKTLAWTNGSGGSLASPGGTLPNLTTAATFTSGTVTLNNQQLTLAGAGQTIRASQGAIVGQASMSVNAAAASRLGFVSTIVRNSSNNVVANSCLFACTTAVGNNGGTLTAYAGLFDLYGNVPAAPDGSVVVNTTAGGNGSVDVTTVTIPAGATTSSSAVKLTSGNGNNWTLTLSVTPASYQQVTATLTK